MKDFAAFLFVAFIILVVIWPQELDVVRNVSRDQVIDEDAVRYNCRSASWLPGVSVTYSIEGKFIGLGGTLTYHIRAPWWMVGRIASNLM